MAGRNYYDVTEWHVGDPYEDIGQVINSIIDDVKKRQTEKDVREGGKPGAVIYIPVGDYHLRTQVVIDISYLKIMGSGHGFTSSSIRFNVPEDEICGLHELWPGGQPDPGGSSRKGRGRRGSSGCILCEAGGKSADQFRGI